MWVSPALCTTVSYTVPSHRKIPTTPTLRSLRRGQLEPRLPTDRQFRGGTSDCRITILGNCDGLGSRYGWFVSRTQPASRDIKQPAGPNVKYMKGEWSPNNTFVPTSSSGNLITIFSSTLVLPRGRLSLSLGLPSHSLGIPAQEALFSNKSSHRSEPFSPATSRRGLQMSWLPTMIAQLLSSPWLGSGD
jgi:hypothetical protein